MTEGASLTIGDHFWVSGITVCAASSVVIGNRFMAGADAVIADTDFHSLDAATRNSELDAARAAVSPVVIEDDVFLGARSIVLKGVHIGRGAVVGAGAVVTRGVPAGVIVAGNPARQVGVVESTKGAP
jgi:acetyltransferase-like isoleucine patch superfamily enzyme